MIEDFSKLIECQVREKILGPGYARDIFACDDDASNEILDQPPTELYCTGVMLPVDSSPEDNDDNVDENQEALVLSDENSTDDGNALEVDNDSESDYDLDKDNELRGRDNDTGRDDRVFFNSNHIGIMACISSSTTAIQLEISYAKYQRLDSQNIGKACICAGRNYEELKRAIETNSENPKVVSFLNENGITEPFASFISFDDENKFVSLNRPIPNVSSKLNRQEIGTDATELLKKLLKGEFYQRVPFKETFVLQLSGNNEDVNVEINDDLSYSYKWFGHNGKIIIKVIVQNKQNYDKRVDSLYSKSLFQSTLRLIPINGNLEIYTEPIFSIDDDENNVTEFIYRDVVNYGKGVACAVRWNKEENWIETTYMPRLEVKKFSNQIDDDKIKQICTLRNLSIWSDFCDEMILDSLNQFVNGYDQWHQLEKEVIADEKYRKTIDAILQRQEELLIRLKDNVKFMRDNPEALKCFKIANTAMLMQMVVSRDSNFAKNRDQVPEESEDLFNSLEYFHNSKYLKQLREEPSYYPFQLAFLLMNVKSTLVEDDPYRTKYVDLIWFPTGGGKTEAYLALTALTIITRRRNSADVISGFSGERPDNYNSGVSVIMRYTLRLLTSQQFERASYLICALEFLRMHARKLGLGNTRISIGLWLGKASTPNSVKEINAPDGKYMEFLDGDDKGESNTNPFPVAYCPWCGKKLKPNDGVMRHGYNEEGYLECQNDCCCFETDTKLPIYYIDDVLYNEKPTLLFATVDKFALLGLGNKKADNAISLIRSTGVKSPDLIIQDELHLISGPLGSTVALFETMVEALSSKDGHRPKIVSSTATTRNTGTLIKSLYGKNREVNVFPAQGTFYKNNYFSRLEEDSRRSHVGIMPTGKATSNVTEIRLTATLLLSRLKLIMSLLMEKHIDLKDPKAIMALLSNEKHYDLYWSIVLYFNSLKDLGRSKSRVSQEVYENLRAKLPYFRIPKELSFLYDYFDGRTKEFTSREESSRIKELLTTAGSPVRFTIDGQNRIHVERLCTYDLVFASNMISVGIDINRWNLMIMMGQPRSTSEYIQSSSRVARSHEGLVFNLLNPLRSREYSLFENYASFHAAYYKYVEPLSATPINMQMLKLPLLANVFNSYKKMTEETDKERIINGIIRLIKDRYELDEDIESALRIRLAEIYDNYNDEGDGNKPMASLRDIEPDCFIKIRNINY